MLDVGSDGLKFRGRNLPMSSEISCLRLRVHGLFLPVRSWGQFRERVQPEFLYLPRFIFAGFYLLAATRHCMNLVKWIQSFFTCLKINIITYHMHPLSCPEPCSHDCRNNVEAKPPPPPQLMAISRFPDPQFITACPTDGKLPNIWYRPCLKKRDNSNSSITQAFDPLPYASKSIRLVNYILPETVTWS